MGLKATLSDLNRRHRNELIARRDAAARWRADGIMDGDALVELASVDMIVDFYDDRLEYRTRLGDGHRVLDYRKVQSVTLRERSSASLSVGEPTTFEALSDDATKMVLTLDARRPLVFDFRTQPVEQVVQAADLIRRRLRARSRNQSIDDTPSFLAPLHRSRAEEIAKLAALRSAGILTDEEFQVEKARILHS